MNKKLLIGTLIVLVIAAAIFKPALIGVVIISIPIGVWVYLVWMVWKKKTKIFHDQMEPKLAKRRLKMLKAFLLVAVISFAMGIVGLIVYPALNYLSDYLILGFFVSTIATISGLVIFLIGRRKTT